jgi:hypothetical protein
MDIMLADHLLLLMQRGSHRYPQGLGLLAPGDDAAIVVGEHHDRLPQQCGIEDPLAGAEEVVAVDQSYHLA